MEEIQGCICWKLGGACGRSNGMGGKARKIIRNGGQPKSHQQYVKRRKPGRLLKRSRSTEISMTERCCIYMDRRKKTAKKSVDKTRNDMEADLYTKLDDGTGKKMVYKMARHRNENSNDVKGGTFIKDRNGKLVTNREEVKGLGRIHYSELLNPQGNISDLELPNYVREKANVIEIKDMEVTRGLEGMTKERAPGWDEMHAEVIDVTGEIGARWTKRLLEHNV